jgi:hypothetical protein
VKNTVAEITFVKPLPLKGRASTNFIGTGSAYPAREWGVEVHWDKQAVKCKTPAGTIWVPLHNVLMLRLAATGSHSAE